MDNLSTLTLSAVDRDTHMKLLSVDVESFDVSKEAIALMSSIAKLILNHAPAADESIKRALKKPEKGTVLKKLLITAIRSALSTALKVWEDEYGMMEQEALFEVMDAAINFGMGDLKILLGKALSVVKVMSEEDNNEDTIVPKAVAALIPPWAKAIRDVFFYFGVPIKTSIIRKVIEYVEKHNENHSENVLNEWPRDFYSSMEDTTLSIAIEAVDGLGLKGLKKLLLKELRRRL